MSIRYLPEHVAKARLALELAQRQAIRLAHTRQTLFNDAIIDLAWVHALDKREDLAEKIDAFVGRFGRLQDHIGHKLIPRFAELLGESSASLLDMLAYAEKHGWLNDAAAFIGARKLRNVLTHEYMIDSQQFLEALNTANEAALMLIDVVNAIARHALMLNI